MALLVAQKFTLIKILCLAHSKHTQGKMNASSPAMCQVFDYDHCEVVMSDLIHQCLIEASMS